MSSPPVSFASSSDFAQSRRDREQGIWPHGIVTPDEAQEEKKSRPRVENTLEIWVTLSGRLRILHSIPYPLTQLPEVSAQISLVSESLKDSIQLIPFLCALIIPDTFSKARLSPWIVIFNTHIPTRLQT